MLKDRERYGISDKNDKDEKYVNGHKFSIGKFPPGKRDYLFRNSVYSGKFAVEQTKKSCSIKRAHEKISPTLQVILHPDQNFRIFLVNGKRSQSIYHISP